MEFWFIVAVVAFAFFLKGKSKPQSFYKKPRPHTWEAPQTKIQPSARINPIPQSHSPLNKIAPDGFRYDPDGEWPFLKKPLITNTEQILFERLRSALPDFHIFTQVQLSQLVHVKKGHSFKMWWSRISRMSVDFVIVNKNMNTVAAIELDDKTHYSDEERHKADAKKDKVLTAAGIRIIRWRCEIMPDIEQISLSFPEHKKIISALKSPPSTREPNKENIGEGISA